MRAVNVLLSVLVSCVLALLVLEGGLRLLPAFRPQDSVNEFHPELGWVKQPNAVVERSTAELDVTFEINSHGLRDDEGPIAKSPNTFRVMALGDSFVLGYTVDRNELFVDQLEHWWNAEHRRVDVINAGTEGYSTDQEVLWFERYGVAYEPDLVLIFPYENDIYWNGQTSYTRFPKPRYAADGTLETGRFEDPGPAPAITRFAIGNFFARALLPLLAGRPVNEATHFQPAGSEEWIFKEFAPLMKAEPAFLADAKQRTRGALLALQRKCEDIGARLVMVPIPSESVVHADQREAFRTHPEGLRGIPDDLWSPERPVNFFRDLGERLGIPVLDPRSALLAKASNGDELYFDAEWHFNAKGNRAFADYLRIELDNLGVFPDAHQAIAAGAWIAPQDGRGFPTWLGVFAVLWLVLGVAYTVTYRDEAAPAAFLKVGALLAVVFTIILGGSALVRALPPSVGPWVLVGFAALVLGFVVYKLGRRVGTILELLQAFTLRGHWYLMPLVMVLLTIGSLLVVAASSPLIAPFIYTLF